MTVPGPHFLLIVSLNDGPGTHLFGAKSTHFRRMNKPAYLSLAQEIRAPVDMMLYHYIESIYSPDGYNMICCYIITPQYSPDGYYDATLYYVFSEAITSRYVQAVSIMSDIIKPDSRSYRM